MQGQADQTPPATQVVKEGDGYKVHFTAEGDLKSLTLRTLPPSTLPFLRLMFPQRSQAHA